jgi:hypothetical protein
VCVCVCVCVRKEITSEISFRFCGQQVCLPFIHEFGIFVGRFFSCSDEILKGEGILLAIAWF